MKPSERKISAEMSFKEVYAIEERKTNMSNELQYPSGI